MKKAPLPSQPPALGRRTFLGALAAAAVFARTSNAGAQAAPAAPVQGSLVREVVKETHGVTLYLELEQSLFPAAGGGYRDRTVIVYVPSFFRPLGSHVDVVLHFHGFGSTADGSMKSHQLREQLFDSKQNAILVLPQGPVRASDPSCGKLEAPNGLAHFLTDLRKTLQSRGARKAMGKNAIPNGMRIGKLCVSCHSGGYHAAACCVKHGGFNVNEVYLFDALYNEQEVFRDWVVSGKGKSLRRRHKLVSMYGGGSTAGQSLRLMSELEKAGVAVEHEDTEGALTREQLSRAEAVFIRTGLAHSNVTHDTNALRDCLFASGLTRRVRSSWFRHKTEQRRIDRRAG